MKNVKFVLLAMLLLSIISFGCSPSQEHSIKIEPTEPSVKSEFQKEVRIDTVQNETILEQEAKNEHSEKPNGILFLFFAMAAAGASVKIRTNVFQSIWVGFIFEAAEKIAKQFLDKLNYNFMILFTICKKIILALVDKDPNNIEQIKLIFEEHGDELMEFLFKFLSDRLLAKLAKNVNLSETNKQLAMAQPEMMRLTYENAESSDFSEVLANVLLEKKSEYPNLANLTNPTV